MNKLMIISVFACLAVTRGVASTAKSQSQKPSTLGRIGELLKNGRSALQSTQFNTLASALCGYLYLEEYGSSAPMSEFFKKCSMYLALGAFNPDLILPAAIGVESGMAGRSFNKLKDIAIAHGAYGLENLPTWAGEKMGQYILNSPKLLAWLAISGFKVGASLASTLTG